MAFPRVRDKQSYGWVVVAVCVIIGTVTLGTRYSFGVFFKSIEQEFGLSRAVTSAIMSAYMVVCAIISVVGGWALDRYGPRRVMVVMGLFTGVSLVLASQTASPWQLFVFYSLLLGIGTGAGFVVLSATAARWFDRRRGLAVAIATSGSGLGPAIAAPVATLLISHFEWRGAYAIMGVFSGLTMVLLSGLLRREPAERGAPHGQPVKNAGSSDAASLSLQQAFRTKSFWLVCGGWLFQALAFAMIVTHIVPYATDIGISEVEAAMILSLIGFMSTPSRIVIGGISDRIGRKQVAVACALAQAAATLWLVGLQDLWMLYLFAAIYGAGYGGFDAPVTALIGDLFGLRNLGIIVGGASAAWALGAALGPAIGGYIFDVTGSYAIAFLVAALTLVAASACIFFARKVVD